MDDYNDQKKRKIDIPIPHLKDNFASTGDCIMLLVTAELEQNFYPFTMYHAAREVRGQNILPHLIISPGLLSLENINEYYMVKILITTKKVYLHNMYSNGIEVRSLMKSGFISFSTLSLFGKNIAHNQIQKSFNQLKGFEGIPRNALPEYLYEGTAYTREDIQKYLPSFLTHETSASDTFCITDEDESGQIHALPKLITLCKYYTRTVLIKAANLKNYEYLIKGCVSAKSIREWIKVIAILSKISINDSVKGPTKQNRTCLINYVKTSIQQYCKNLIQLPWEKYFVQVGHKTSSDIKDLYAWKTNLEIIMIQQVATLIFNHDKDVFKDIEYNGSMEDIIAAKLDAMNDDDRIMLSNAYDQQVREVKRVKKINNYAKMKRNQKNVNETI